MIRKLEKYEILEEIGHGGMATVYRAHDTVLDRAVALKVMHPHLRGAEEARRRFWREARSVARLHHPRVLEIYDFSGEGSNEAYIAAELLTGPTLKVFREAQKDVPAEIAACFVIEIAKALEAAHAAGIVHRDVKPENVLLHEARTIKLTDFGIADMVDSQSMTATGQILGSPGHMAPEQIEGKDSDPRTDLFSAGTVLYYLATGRLPFTGRNPHQILKRIIDGEYADPLRVNPAIGNQMRQIIIKCLERDPAMRYQSARELVEALEGFVREIGIDNPEQCLEQYLKDPEKITGELRLRAIPKLIEQGQRASDAGDVPVALDYYNRVLALDEGNERVLRLIERVGNDRRRRIVLWFAASLSVLGMATAGAAWALWPGPQVPIPPIDASPDAGLAAILAEPIDSGPPDSGVVLEDAGSDAGTEVTPVALGPRTVILEPRPASVTIGVDGEAPNQFGTSFDHVDLRPGRHTFLVHAIGEVANLFHDQTFTRNIPSGAGDYHLPLELDYAPAAVQITCNASGTVTIAGAPSFRTGTISPSITLRSPHERRTYTVQASGYLPFRGEIQLNAGDATEDTVELEPEP